MENKDLDYNTKVQIILRLLKDNNITTAEAVILLENKNDYVIAKVDTTNYFTYANFTT